LLSGRCPQTVREVLDVGFITVLRYDGGMTMAAEPPLVTAKQAEVDAAWRDEVSRRLDDLESGRVQPVSGNETSAMLDAMIK